MICVTSRCGRTEDEFQALVQEFLPPGAIYSIDDPDRCFSKFWLAVSDVFHELEQCICCLYANAIPCSPGYNPECDAPAPVPTCQPVGYVAPKTLLERHALTVNFPLDCVALSHDKLCQWVDGNGCRVGSVEWLQWLLDFTGTGATIERIQGGLPYGCMEYGCDPYCANPTRFVVTCPALEMPEVKPFAETPLKNAFCHSPQGVCPKVEALRPKYFPAGIPVTYET